MCASFASSCDASPVLEAAEHALDPEVLPIEQLVIGERSLPGPVGESAGVYAPLMRAVLSQLPS